MATRTVHVKYNGKSGRLGIKIDGYTGKNCDGLANSITSKIHAVTEEQKYTVDISQEEVPQVNEQSQRELA